MTINFLHLLLKVLLNLTTDKMPKNQDERRDATEEEIQNLRHVVDSLPFVVWIALIASGAERFTFYAVTTPWRKFWNQYLYIKHTHTEIFLLQRITRSIPGIVMSSQAL